MQKVSRSDGRLPFAAAPPKCWASSPNWILCGNGSDDILTIVTRAFVGQGELLRLPYPSYILYNTLAQLQGAEAEEVHFQADWSLAMSSPQPRAGSEAGVSAQSEQPVGHDDSAGANAASWPTRCPARCWSMRRTSILPTRIACRWWQETDKILVTRSLSKSYALAGLRFGYRRRSAADDRAAGEGEGFVQLRCAVDRRRDGRHRRSGLAGRQSGERSWRRAARLTAGMRELGFATVDSQANFVWNPHPTVPVKPLYEQLKAERRPGAIHGLSGWGDGLRISVGTDEQIDACLTLLQGMMIVERKVDEPSGALVHSAPDRNHAESALTTTRKPVRQFDSCPAPPPSIARPPRPRSTSS